MNKIWIPKNDREKVDMLIANLFPKKFPVEEQHYGDLAMRASGNVNANKVNMLAFLADFRHPTEMIPKLRNLSQLKTLSNNYLAVKYGILPTVDDIQSIVKAFRRHAPFFDKNGYATYSAAHHDSKVIGEITYDLEQHIKLAIDDVDIELLELISRLDSMGTLPTCKNIWDLIPFSFVIDWFVDVGNFLERIDSNFRIARLNVRYATMSRKQTVDGLVTRPTAVNPFSGSVRWVHYHRWISDQCPVPPLSPKPIEEDFNHWLESGALLMQRT